MPADMFLKLDGIPGESKDDKHKDEIEIESWSWGESQIGTAGRGGGGGAGKVQAQDLTFVKRADKATPKLFMACATGEHIKNGILMTRKAGGGQQEYFKVTLEDVLISSYSVSGGGSDIPVEQVSLNFAKIEFSYKEQKADGSLGGEVKQKYDFAANVKI